MNFAGERNSTVCREPPRDIRTAGVGSPLSYHVVDRQRFYRHFSSYRKPHLSFTRRRQRIVLSLPRAPFNFFVEPMINGEFLKTRKEILLATDAIKQQRLSRAADADPFENAIRPIGGTPAFERHARGAATTTTTSARVPFCSESAYRSS